MNSWLQAGQHARHAVLAVRLPWYGVLIPADSQRGGSQHQAVHLLGVGSAPAPRQSATLGPAQQVRARMPALGQPVGHRREVLQRACARQLPAIHGC
ncbi:MAG: hypothetical protein KatS3mg061_0008 [Dehalococcoidia bacterium]|nr:MAG: hypothetical protein KatS3mg061_0008 [Dehalococcoidia bacterium]